MEQLSALTYETTGRVARITLSRPERGNGITLEMPTEITVCVERANLDPNIHVIALAGNGRSFCVGYDLVLAAEHGFSVDATSNVPEGSPLDPRVQLANHDPGGAWDPMVDYDDWLSTVTCLGRAHDFALGATHRPRESQAFALHRR
jgi:enoyl-CoA hydratase